jgi:hypothetical protein
MLHTADACVRPLALMGFGMDAKVKGAPIWSVDDILFARPSAGRVSKSAWVVKLGVEADGRELPATKFTKSNWQKRKGGQGKVRNLGARAAVKVPHVQVRQARRVLTSRILVHSAISCACPF